MCQIIFVSYFCFGICMPHTAASDFSCISCMARAFAIASNHWNIPHATSFYVIVIGTVRLFRVAQCFAARTTDVIFSFFSCSSRAFAIASNHWNMIDSPPKNSRSRFSRNIFCADGLFCAGFCQTIFGVAPKSGFRIFLRNGFIRLCRMRLPDFFPSAWLYHTHFPHGMQHPKIINITNLYIVQLCMLHNLTFFRYLIHTTNTARFCMF